MSILQVYSSIPLLTSILGKLETNISSSSKAVAATRRGGGGGSFNSREKKSTKNIVTFQKCFELKFYI